MKRENCPICGHRWIRRSDENPIICPNCGSQFTNKELEEYRRQKLAN